MRIDEADEEWEGYNSSGYVPMILAGYRMSAARRAFPGLGKLTESITKDVESEAADVVAWANAHQYDVYPDEPEIFVDPAAAGDYASEMLAVTGELESLFFGSLITYLLSTLEATLADCLEVAQIVTRHPVAKKVPNPKIDNYVKALDAYGVHIGWDEKMWTSLHGWRKVRNNFVHILETTHWSGDLSSSAAQEVFWLVDAAIRKLDYAMSALKPLLCTLTNGGYLPLMILVDGRPGTAAECSNTPQRGYLRRPRTSSASLYRLGASISVCRNRDGTDYPA